MKYYKRTRNLIRSNVLNILGQFSSPQPGIHILNGHKLTLNSYPTDDEVDKFRRLLSSLIDSNVRFINFEKAVDMICKKNAVDECYVAFTWDDGFAEHKIAANVLKEFGVNCCLFVNPNYTIGDENYIKKFNHITGVQQKKPLRWCDLADLQADGHIIGAHTMDHYMISNSDDMSALEYQIIKCKEEIEHYLGNNCIYFAWPFGRQDQADEKSIKLACSTYKYVFSQSDYKNYFSFNGRVINRRHFEPFWPLNHVKFFLSTHKKY